MIRILLTFILFAVVAGMSTMMDAGNTLGQGMIAGSQFDNSAASYLGFTAGSMFLRGLTSWPGVVLLLGLVALWIGPLKRAASVAVLLGLCFAATPAQAFYDTTDRTEVYYVLPNQSAFWIPDVGNNAATQVQFGSAAYYDANKIPAKRFIVPHAKLSGSGGTAILSGFDYYVPTGRLYIVDRSPFFREWVDASDRGTSISKEGFHFETLDSVDIGTGLTIGASVSETEAAQFLYNFGTKTTGDMSRPENQFNSVIWGFSLSDIMDTKVRGKAQQLLAAEFSKRTFVTALTQKADIMDAVAKGLRDEYGPKGINITFVGYSGALDFDPAIQYSIDRTVIAANDVLTAAKIKDSLPSLAVKAQIDAINTAASRWDGHLAQFMLGGVVDALNAVFNQHVHQ